MRIANQTKKSRQAIPVDSQNRRENFMEKAFAYICASEEAAPRLLRRYCRKVFELGYIPICPALIEGQYLTMDNLDDKRDFRTFPVKN